MKNRKGMRAAIYALGIGAAAATAVLLNQNIRLTLFPYAAVLHWLYGYRFSFVSGVGYCQSGGMFAISQSCMGSRLFLCLFLIMLLGFLKDYRNKAAAAAAFYGISLTAAFALTVIRMAVSLPFCGRPDFKLIHTLLSLAVYFGAGLLTCHIMRKISERRPAQ